LEQFAGQIPQRHVDAAQGPHGAAALFIGIEHVVEVDLDGQRILADQSQVGQASAAIIGPDHRTRCIAVGAAFAIAADARIGVDADQGLRILYL